MGSEMCIRDRKSGVPNVQINLFLVDKDNSEVRSASSPEKIVSDPDLTGIRKALSDRSTQTTASNDRINTVVYIPVFSALRKDVLGVLRFEAPSLTKKDMEKLQQVGTLLGLLWATRNALDRATPTRQRKRIRELVSVLLESARKNETHASRLTSVAKLIIELYKSAVVDIWPVDWQHEQAQFPSESGVNATSPAFEKKWPDYQSNDLVPVSYTHLTLPTICSV